MKWLERFGLSAPRVRYGLRDLPALVRTPVGRRQIVRALVWMAWYVVAPLAWLDRRLRLARHPIVAITGTFGKTTTASATEAALGSPRHPTNFRTHLAWRLLRIRRGDPPAVFEVGISRPGQMASYARLLAPRVAVVTAVGSEHISAFGTLERIAVEKGRLLAPLGPRDVAVLNGDDPRVAAMAGATAARVVTFGHEAGRDVRAENVRLDWPHGTRFDLTTAEGSRPGFVPALGRHGVSAALAAIAVARALGQDEATTLRRLADFEPPPGRLQPVELANGAWLLRDDFKNELETIEAALDVFEAIPARRKLVVLGPINEPPNPQRAAYRRIGARLGASVDRIVVCGPIGSNFGAIASSARAAGLARDSMSALSSVEEVIRLLEPELTAGDVVLLKGPSNLRFERIALALAGVTVGCNIRRCYIGVSGCERCPMLEPGWGGMRELT
jgi:UDP-N-acetylmuramyl pentapeptide synthase